MGVIPLSGVKGTTYTQLHAIFDSKIYKTQVEARVAGEWFLCEVLNILTLFLWLVQV